MEHIVERLRPEDVDEAEAWGLNRFAVRDTLLALDLSKAWVVYKDRDPVFIFGLKHLVGKTWTLWGLGTPEAKAILRPMSKWATRVWTPAAFSCGLIDRIEVRVPLSSSGSWGWLLWLGGNIDARLNCFGAHGEDFILMSMTRTGYEQRKLKSVH